MSRSHHSASSALWAVCLLPAFLVVAYFFFLGPLAAFSVAFAEEPSPASAPAPIDLRNATCPITGEPALAEVTEVWNGMKVRFCCPGCIPEFRQDPAAKVAALLKDLAKQLAEAQARIRRLEEEAAASPRPAGVGSAPLPPPTPPTSPPPAPPAPPSPPAVPTAPVPAPPSSAPLVVRDLENATCPVMLGKATKAAIVTEHHGMKVRFCCAGCINRFRADPAKYLRVLCEDPAVAKRVAEAEAAWAAAHAETK